MQCYVSMAMGLLFFKEGGIYVFFSPDTGPGLCFMGAGAQHQQAAAVLRGQGTCKGQWATLSSLGRGRNLDQKTRPRSHPCPRAECIGSPQGKSAEWAGEGRAHLGTGCCPFAVLLAPGGNI